MYALDNTSTVTDSSGNILFYTNGRSVWNKNHVVMLNGNGLMGSGNSSHGSLILPKPGSSSIYYIFTTDSFAGAWGCRYSEVDLLLDNGFGAVTSNKNILLFAPSPEKLAAIKHSNDSDIWVVTHRWGTNEFYSYLLSSQGLNPIPVVSSVGSIHVGGSYNTYNAMGQMTASPDGSKLAVAIYDLNKVELFDFNRTTGLLSNLITLSSLSHPWGLEFSANGQKLYLSKWTYTAITQFDLSVYSQQAILNSAVTVGNATSTGSYHAGFMQMGPDGRIYIAKYDNLYMSVINDPDQTGTACNFVNNGFYLAGKTCKSGITIGFKCYQDILSSNIETTNSGNSVTLYPNPVLQGDEINVSCNYSDIKFIEIKDVVGQLVFCNYNSDFNISPIPTKSFSPGLYFLNVHTDKGSVSTKFIVIK